MTTTRAVATPHPASLQRFRSEGLRLFTGGRGAFRELHLTLPTLPGEAPARLWRRLREVLAEHEAVIARQEVFGPVADAAEGRRTMERELGRLIWPVTWVEGAGVSGPALAGTHVLAVAGTRPAPIPAAGAVLGTVFSDGEARHHVLGGLAFDRGGTREAQARGAFARLHDTMAEAGLGFANVVRTWFFLDEILAWYEGFNQVRTAFFREQGVFDGLIPASTGIGTRNPGGTPVVAGAWAVEPLRAAARVRAVASPRQCPATRYGSSFSRAVEVESGGLRRLFVSGTASIEPGGASVCGGDAEAQMDLTMEVVRAILVSREMDFGHVTRATAYFRRPADAPRFAAWRARRGLEDWPLLATQAVVCRDELLFEIEVDAIVAATDAGGEGS